MGGFASEDGAQPRAHREKQSPLTSSQPRQHPADEVYVTGTFDDWAKSVKLENKGEHFEKLVELPSSNEKIFYKVRTLHYPTAAPFFQSEEIQRIHKARIDFSQRHCTASPHYTKWWLREFLPLLTSLKTSAKGPARR